MIPTWAVQSMYCVIGYIFPSHQLALRSRGSISTVRSRGWRTACIVLLLSATAAIASSAQTFTVLHNFDGSDGNVPQGGVILGLDGNLYGTTYEGGANGNANNPDGTAYKVTQQGALTVLHSFCTQTGCAGGAAPTAGLVLGTDGNFYGTAEGAGANGGGTVFKITSQGVFTTLYNFCVQPRCTDGSSPTGALTQGTDGNFYGTTNGGGANGDGTVFKITPQGALTTLYSFCPQTGCADGKNPWAGVVQGSDGNFYGTAQYGGAHGGGTAFKITPQGKFTTLYSFCALSNCGDGENPFAALIQAADGSYYGTTLYGGTNGGPFGTVFKITAQGKLTTVYSFCSVTGCKDGITPYGGLVQGPDGTFYGTTNTDGENFEGTIFSLTPQGTLTTLFNFCVQSSCTDGAGSFSGVALATNGKLYGTTPGGGTNGFGTVYSLDIGLGAFVQALPASGKVGATIRIEGTNLTGATAVSFNGTAATFTVVSGTQIKTTVPSGATTGKIKVTTPHGVLSSNKIFRVTP
jgi:uncharacterized repeat protein (TIGR03803 family)